EGLTLLPTHRIVEIDSDIHPKEALQEFFDIERIDAADTPVEAVRKHMFEQMKKKQHSFGMYLTNSDAYYIMSHNGKDLGLNLPECLKRLDVSVLHRFIFEKILKVDHYEYEKEASDTVERARSGSYEAAFFLNSTKIHELKEVALAGHRMPPKSTYFYPKLLTGMVIYKY
nr:DUF1015 family protein [bacterium]